jgi:hypothetical protein
LEEVPHLRRIVLYTSSILLASCWVRHDGVTPAMLLLRNSGTAVSLAALPLLLLLLLLLLL